MIARRGTATGIEIGLNATATKRTMKDATAQEIETANAIEKSAIVAKSPTARMRRRNQALEIGTAIAIVLNVIGIETEIEIRAIGTAIVIESDEVEMPMLKAMRPPMKKGSEAVTVIGIVTEIASASANLNDETRKMTTRRKMGAGTAVMIAGVFFNI